jgi:hypothetical protein
LDGIVKNVTITLDEETAAWARIRAAQQGTSLSRMVGALLRQEFREMREYDDAMRRFLARSPTRLKRSAERYATREALHERNGIR